MTLSAVLGRVRDWMLGHFRSVSLPWLGRDGALYETCLSSGRVRRAAFQYPVKRKWTKQLRWSDRIRVRRGTLIPASEQEALRRQIDEIEKGRKR